MDELATYFLRPGKQRPDFRLVISFLWSDLHNVDTEGDSHNPASRDWTELYIQNREQPAEVVEVWPVSDEPLVLAVRSDREYMAARVTYFLALETGSGVAVCPGGTYEDVDSLVPALGADFDLPAALRRGDESVWRRSTLRRPYPNLDAD